MGIVWIMLFLNYVVECCVVSEFMEVGLWCVLIGLFIIVIVSGVFLLWFVISEIVVSIGIVGWYIEIMCRLCVLMWWMNFWMYVM